MLAGLSLQIDYKYKNQNWRLMQKPYEKENEKIGADC